MTKGKKKAKLKAKHSINLKAMAIKIKPAYLWTAAAAIALLAVWAAANSNFSRRFNKPASPEPSRNANPPAAAEKPQINVWEGLLEKSDNPDKGNLLLKTSAQVIYIQTSRDFNRLLGKQVRVTYQGSLQNFMLGDITLAEQE